MEKEKISCYVGIDLNDSYAMVSYYQPGMEEPQTVSMIAGSENYHIPLLLARRKNIARWYYGEEAGKMARTSEVICVEGLLQRALAKEVIGIGGENYDSVDLLALFIRKVMELPMKLGNMKRLSRLVLTVERLTKENMELFWAVAKRLELTPEQFMVADHKESFSYYALSQQEELWFHDVFLYHCVKNQVYSYDLTRDTHTRPQVISIRESGKTHLKDADREFAQLLAKDFTGRMVSTVYLVGDGFEGGWMKKSLEVMCKGRRVFLGQNLFSKGACYAAGVRDLKEDWPFIYMGENEMKFNLSIKVKDRGKEGFFNLISAGKNWFETRGTCEVILSGTPDIEFWKQLPSSREAEVKTVELDGLPERPDRTTRLRILAVPVSDHKIEVEIQDLGFGEMFRGSDRVWKYTMVM